MPKKVRKAPLAPDRGGMLLAVDPGDVHVGVSWFDYLGEDTWACVFVTEMTPDEFEDYLGPALRSGLFRYFVLESFALYGDKALEQTGSQFLTSQLIGVCKYVVKEVNREAHLNPDLEREVELVLQQPSIKKAVFAICARQGYKFTADRLKVPGQHVKDAEVHGVKYVRDTLGHKLTKTPELWDEPRPETPLA